MKSTSEEFGFPTISLTTRDTTVPKVQRNFNEGAIILQSRTVLASAFAFMGAGFVSQFLIRVFRAHPKKCMAEREHKYI